MKILIAGANSFVARSIYPKLVSDGHDVVSVSRKEIDFTDFNQVKYLFKSNSTFDIVINCTANGGRKFITPDTLQHFHDNIKINENLLFHNEFYNKIINFGSGSEHNQENDIFNVSETDFSSIPNNYYGLSKYINSRRHKYEPKSINLILFNCFGPMELSNRFITTAIKNYINHQPIEIWHNIYLDFFYINDLYSIIKYILSIDDIPFKELNCCYYKKTKMSDICSIINRLNNYQVPIIIKNENGNNYCGNGELLLKYKHLIPFDGLDVGIQQTYKSFLNE